MWAGFHTNGVLILRYDDILLFATNELCFLDYIRVGIYTSYVQDRFCLFLGLVALNWGVSPLVDDV